MLLHFDIRFPYYGLLTMDYGLSVFPTSGLSDFLWTIGHGLWAMDYGPSFCLSDFRTFPTFPTSSLHLYRQLHRIKSIFTCYI